MNKHSCDFQYFTNSKKSILCQMLFVLLLMGISLTACHERDDRINVTEKQRTTMDSTLRACRDTTALKVIIKKYKTGNNLLGEAMAYRYLGKAYRDNSNFSNALKTHETGLKKAKEISDTLEIIQALNNIGTNYRRLGLLDVACEYHIDAVKLSTNFSDKESQTAKKNHVISLNGLGNVYLTLGNGKLAENVFRQALKGEKELGSAIGQAINYANIGSIFEQRGDIDSAWVYYRKSLKLNEEAKSNLGISLCYNHFGQLYESSNLLDKAIGEYKKAYDMMEDEGDEWHWLESCISLAGVYIKKGDFATAKSFLDKANTVAENIHSNEHLAEIYQYYYQIYNSSGDKSTALDCFVKANMYKDSVVNIKKVNEIHNLRANLEHMRQKSELELAQKNYDLEKSSKRIAYLILLLELLVASGLIGILWYMLRVRTRTQRMTLKLQKAREHFFTNITHEFRTPLTVILGHGQQMENATGDDLESIRKSGKTIVRQGNNLLQLINQLLDISKVKSEIGEPDWRRGDIVPYMKMIEENYREYAKQKQIELTYIPQESKVYMDFVPDYMLKIMRNLISNALKFTPEHGKIVITTHKSNDKLLINVADTGVGIPPEGHAHIFDAFYQADNDSRAVGTGVGLSLVKQIVMAMNGDITVESELAKGTTFHITLPLRHGGSKWKTLTAADFGQYETDGLELSETVQTESNTDEEDATRLLIVEDNKDIADYIGSLLSQKYSIFHASNGKEGLEKAMSLVPDLVITDLMMPEMDGLELSRQLRKTEITNHIPIIAITAKTTQEDRNRGLEAGVDAYLNKPFNPEELHIRVNKLLEQRRLLREKYSQALTEGKEEEVGISDRDRAFVTKIVDVVYSMMGKNSITVEAVASELCMSPAQFRRKVFATTGEKPAAYILRIRLSYAKRLLIGHPEYNIGDIAMKCGFEDNAHFTRTFRQLFDMTPTQYRRKPE